VKVKFSKIDGYIELYKNGEMVASIAGMIYNGPTNYLKLGMYSIGDP
jgi:hypothetical protein